MEAQQTDQRDAEMVGAGVDSKDRAAEMRVERDMARKDVSAQAEIARKQMLAQNEMEMKRQKAASDVRP